MRIIQLLLLRYNKHANGYLIYRIVYCVFLLNHVFQRIIFIVKNVIWGKS